MSINRINLSADSRINKMNKFWTVRDTICANPNACEEFDDAFLATLADRLTAQEWQESLDRATRIHLDKKQ